MTTSVWVKLFIGENDQHPAVFKIKPIPADIDDLRTEIRDQEQLECRASLLDIYEPGTTYPNLEERKLLDLEQDVPEDTSSKKPLIVVAPAPVSVSFGFSQESPLV